MPNRHAIVRSDDRVVCERCLVADRPFGRMRGLLGRSELSRGEGVLLRPASSVHTFFMRFPIDIVFVDGDGRVLAIFRRVRPWRAVGARGAREAIELAAGEADARGLVVGSLLVVDDPAAAEAVPSAAREAAQTMAEYAVVLAVITTTIVTTFALLSDKIVRVIDLARDRVP